MIRHGGGVLAFAGLLAVLVIFGASPREAFAVPANNNFANAITIATPAFSGIVATGSTVGATTQSGEPTALPSCQRYNPSAPMGATAWFNWTSPGTAGTVVLSTVGSDFDTFLGVHTGSAVNALTTVVCMNDFWNVVQDTRTSLALTYSLNTTYRIQLGGASGATGNFVLSIITGAELFVTHGADNTNVDGAMSLREAILLARGGTTASGLNRAPDAGETFATTNVGAAGAAGSDVIHFYSLSFPVEAPERSALAARSPTSSPAATRSAASAPELL